MDGMTNEHRKKKHYSSTFGREKKNVLFRAMSPEFLGSTLMS